MPKKLCTAPQCNAIVDHNNDGSSPRCEKHQRKYDTLDKKEAQRRYEHHYDDKGRNIYSTWRWKKLRAAKVAINPLCEHCEKNGVATKVQEVDHILSILDGGEIWDMDNLQSLCKRHHLIKTRKEEAARLIKKDRFGYHI